MSLLLPPVPPITKEGFDDPVWPKWLAALHRIVTTNITLVGDVTGSGTDVINTTLKNSPQARINLGLGTIATQSADNVAITGGTVSSSTLDGTIVSDNAKVGFVGEYKEIATITAVSLPQNTITNVVTLVLTAGDWDVSGVVQTSGVSSITAGVSLSTANGPLGSYVSGPNPMLTFSVPSIRVAISSTTNIYLPVSAVYTSTTCTAYGYLRARRIR